LTKLRMSLKTRRTSGGRSSLFRYCFTLMGYSSNVRNVNVCFALLGLEARLVLDCEDSVTCPLWSFGTWHRVMEGAQEGACVRDGLRESPPVRLRLRARIETGVSLLGRFSSACPSLADDVIRLERVGVCVVRDARFLRGGIRLAKDAHLRNEGEGTRFLLISDAQKREWRELGCGVGKSETHAKTEHFRQQSSSSPPRRRFGTGAILGEAIIN
jgi:hypothetical protein